MEASASRCKPGSTPLASVGSVELPEKIDIPLESHLECERECWASSSVGLGLLAPFLALDSKTTHPLPSLGPPLHGLC